MPYPSSSFWTSGVSIWQLLRVNPSEELNFVWGLGIHVKGYQKKKKRKEKSSANPRRGSAAVGCVLCDDVMSDERCSFSSVSASAPSAVCYGCYGHDEMRVS